MIDEVLTCRTYTLEDGEEMEVSSYERFAELIEQFWNGDLINRTTGISNLWQRIVFGYETLLDNACDPNSKFLEWREDIAKFLENKNEETHSPFNVFKVQMSDELSREFEEIKNENGFSGEEVFRRAIAFYRLAKSALNNGESVVLRSKFTEREITDC